MSDAAELGQAGEVLEAEIVPAAAPALSVTPQVDAGELVLRLNEIRKTQEQAMERDVDYGVIPGTDKPSLLKPGAEKLAVLFQLDVQLANEKQWGPDDHLTVLSHATVFHAPTGSRLGYGEGICTTRERKYAYRQQQRECPSCGERAIIKGKEDFGGGWVCWKKRNGCGSKFEDGDERIEGQEAGEIENPDLPDLWNTVVKMAEKRARVDAVLAVTGASALFTQDAEDIAPSETAQREERVGFPEDGKQRRYFKSLIEKAGGKENTVAAIEAYMASRPRREISEAIDRMKDSDDDGKAVAKELAEAANAWQAKQTDVPADPVDYEPTEKDEEVPF